MDRWESHGGSNTIEARAAAFIEKAEWLISNAPSREDAYELIFGIGGPYMTLFPSIDDRLALRDLPARGRVFAMVERLPVRCS